MIAHRFKKGNRIRAAISESLWPLIWPSPQIATLRYRARRLAPRAPGAPRPAKEAPFTIPVIHADLQDSKSARGYANGLHWVKTPLAAPKLPADADSRCGGTNPI